MMITITPPDGRDQWIFSQVQQRPPGERAAFLDGACAFDKGLPLLTGGGGLAFLPPDGNTLISRTSEEVCLWRAPSWAQIEAAAAREQTEARRP